jgi:hypothetical protein
MLFITWRKASGMNASPTKSGPDNWRGIRWLFPRCRFVVGFSRDAIRFHVGSAFRRDALRHLAKNIGHLCLSYKKHAHKAAGFDGFSRVAASLLASAAMPFVNPAKSIGHECPCCEALLGRRCGIG